jgi:signal transduction histidine kinase
MLVSSARTRLNEKETGLVLKILGNAKELKRLIEDMHMVYKLDMRLQHSFSETRIVEVVDDVLQDTSSVMAEKGICVEKKVSLRDGVSTSIKCDPMRIKQVLVNLLKNSADFVPGSGGKISLELEDTYENRQDVTSQQSRGLFVMFSLKDNGPGVPSDKISGLFRKFYQVDLKAIRRHGGTGLGLAICKEIVEMHGGSIWYDSEYKDGACFRFVLPAFPGSKMSISDNS